MQNKNLKSKGSKLVQATNYPEKLSLEAEVLDQNQEILVLGNESF